MWEERKDERGGGKRKPTGSGHGDQRGGGGGVGGAGWEEWEETREKRKETIRGGGREKTETREDIE